ncbi:MAG: integrase arm-type DNA-binding domain-containing protein [Sphingomonadaceae bacterium]
MAGRLTARQVERLGPGRHSDGNGLILTVKLGGARSWTFRFQRHGRRAEVGLGSFPEVSLAKARKLALECAQAVVEGRDLAAERQREREAPTVREALTAWMEKRAGKWRGGLDGKTARQVLPPFERHLPGLLRRKVKDVGEAEIARLFAPLVRERPELARKMLERLRLALRLARAQGYGGRIDWETVREMLPDGRPAVRHHPALPLAEVPAFVADLQARDSMAARVLLFAILTAARSGEARKATWEEIDWRARSWRIPPERMKAGRAHDVPLSDTALAVLQAAKAEAEALWPGEPWCFPSRQTGRPMTDVALSKLCRARGCTAHGFRSAFRDWCAEAGIDREAAEMALAHAAQGGRTEAAYRRTGAVERRRGVMERWAAFCTGKQGQVVRISQR